jgi:uncharacterized protein (TIGR02118 family)
MGDRRMIKLFAFLKRKRELSREDFFRYWRDVHAPLLIEDEEFMRHARRYVLNLAVSGEGVPVMTFSDFDGVAEVWFDSLDELLAAVRSPGYEETSASSTGRFVDRGSAIRLAAEESVQFDRGFGKVKFIGLSRRHSAMSHDEWCRYWIDVHGPLAHGIPEFTRYYGKYVHNYVVPLDDGWLDLQHEYDGIVEEWLESAEDMAKCLAEPNYLEFVRPDEVKFVDFERSHMVLAQEHVVYDGIGGQATR